jgi:nitrite reductase/ring-hydroxylating ferredoxin subunit
MSTNKTRHAVATVAELPPGARKIVRVAVFGKEIEIGVFNVGGRLVAYRNVCPHAGAPVCEGHICGTTLPSAVYEYSLAREGEILRCPWHGWEFDLLTGEHLVDEKMKLRAYAVETQESGGRNDNLEAFPVETQDETIFVLIGVVA